MKRTAAGKNKTNGYLAVNSTHLGAPGISFTSSLIQRIFISDPNNTGNFLLCSVYGSALYHLFLYNSSFISFVIVKIKSTFEKIFYLPILALIRLRC